MNKINIELQLNSLLQKSFELEEHLRAKGQKEEAQELLAFSSNYAQFILKLHNIKPQPVICYSCKKQLRVGTEIEFYKNVGHCYNCDSSQNIEVEGYGA
jgi:hypothetical protein